MFKSWLFNPVSPQELGISNLFIVTLIIAAIIFALVCGLLLYAVVRFRARPGQPEPYQQFGIPRLEIAWTTIPAVLLIVLFVFTVRVMNASQPSSAQGGDDIVVIGHQWWWEIRYPRSGVVTANEIHLPVGKRMLVRLESADVIHSLWLPQLGGKIDLVPGQSNHMWLEADKPGTYLGACSEYCGAEHAWMLIRAIAQTPAQFAAWQRRQLRPASSPIGAAAVAGSALFGQITCSSCHAIYGAHFQATIGPDLTHVGSRETLAAGLLANTPANMALWLHNPDALKPGVRMPNLKLSATQVQELTAYLEELK
ncbi:MAG TPA: cytochrome c oxidase subunit II [Chloroflexota bacterium]|nr:cytochrome c oxidase subunit II [Chloroflexota bacterium]